MAAAPLFLVLLLAQAVPLHRTRVTAGLGDAIAPLAWAIAFTGTISSVVDEGVLRRVFEGRTLRFFGRYSYGIYLFHHPMRRIFEKLAPPARLAAVMHSAVAASLVFMVVGIVLATAVAWVSYHLVEKRFLALKARF
jgi:peptidoglycan/LPS O-acetylase OafA/YrhL